MNTEEITLSDLGQFTGTDNYYKHWLGYKYTDGVKYLAEKTQCYWLLDAIFSYHRKEPFQVWELVTFIDGENNKGAILTMRQDTGAKVEVRQEIEYTDFTLPSIKLWLIEGVLILPSEY